MFDHGDPAGFGIGPVAFILAGEDVNLRIEPLAARAITVGRDNMKQGFAAAGGGVAPAKAGRVDRDDGCGPRHPAFDEGFM